MCDALFPGRYDRNKSSITEEDQQNLRTKKVCVVGCGGLGGGIIESLTRIGVGHITAVDCDVFEDSNLNRQVLSNENNMGSSKALEAMRQMNEINSEVTVTPIQQRLNRENAETIVHGHDLVIDALDNIGARLVIEDACEAENITLIHGAIEGWNGQVAVIKPKQKLLHEIYGEYDPDHDEIKPESGNLSFTPAVVGAIQAAEAVKLLLHKESVLEGRLLVLDLMTHEYEIIEL